MASHCLVRWEDNAKEFAVVDTRRSKSVSALKVGVTTCFEGFDRKRRRGTILFLGSKKDCGVYGLDVGDGSEELNLIHWSSPPGLLEQAEQIGQALRENISSLKRTVSNMSSSSTASTSKKPTQKKNKLTNDSPNDDELTDKQKSMQQRPLASTITIGHTFDTPDTPDQYDEQLTTTNPQKTLPNAVASSSTNVTTCSTEVTSLQEENKTLREKVSLMDIFEEENKKLREKSLSLEDEILYIRNTSIRIPDEQTYNYMKSIINTYEQRKADANPKLIELEEKFPCTKLELQKAKLHTNHAKTINDLIKFCYKGIDLKEQCYSKLKARDPILMQNIYSYVSYLFAPKIITQTEFSSVVSLRCRHLR